MTGINPLDWYGPQFLMLYAALFVGAVVASFVIAHWLRPDGRSVRLSDPEEFAVLKGGRDRFAEVVTARLLLRGGLKVEKQQLIRLPGAGRRQRGRE